MWRKPVLVSLMKHPTHMIIYIHKDIYRHIHEDRIPSKLLTFANDKKSASEVTTTHDKETLQSDLDRLTCWTNE